MSHKHLSASSTGLVSQVCRGRELEHHCILLHKTFSGLSFDLPGREGAVLLSDSAQYA